MISSARAGLAVALMALAVVDSHAAAQTPVVTMTASTTRIAERLVLTRTTTSPTLTTTTTTTLRTSTTTTTVPTTNAVTFTVTRTGPTELTDLTVRYSVSGTALNGKDYSSLGGTVTIPRTQSSATFTVTAIDDSDDEPDETIVVNLTSTATSPYVLTDPAGATVTIVDDDDVRLIGLDIETDSILAGATVGVRLTLSGAAPAGGLTVPLSASDGSVTAPTISIAAGTRVGIGQISTTSIPSALSVVVRGSAGGVTGLDTLVLFPAPRILRVELNRDIVFGGVPVRGTVYLESPAPPIVSGVDLRARLVLQTASRTTVGSGTSFSTVPTGTLTSPPVTIASTAALSPGATSATFDVQTDDVSMSAEVQLTALIGSSSARASLAIHPVPSIASSTFDPNPVEGGDDVAWSIVLENPIPAGLSWAPSASSSSTAISTGGQGGVRVYFGDGASEWTGRLPTRPVRSRETACLRLNLPGGAYASGGCLSLLPPAITDFSINRDALWGGQPLSGSITSTRSVGGTYYVRIDVDVLSPAGAASPITGSRVSIPSGEATATWTLQTSAVTQATTVRIRAAGGAADTVTLHPLPTVTTVDFSPDSAIGGNPAPVAIRLDRPVPAGLSFDLTLVGQLGVLPSGSRTVQVAGGQTGWTGTVETAPVPGRTTATLSVNGGFAYKLILLARPPAVSAIGVQPRAVVGGNPVSFTVQLDQPAAAGGTAVSLRTSAPAVLQLPPGITIPAGSDRTTFQAATTAVPSQQIVDFEASANGARVTGQLRVDPEPTPSVTTLRTSANNARVAGGTTIDFIVELDRPAPAGGAVVQLQTSRPDLLDISSITVAPNATTGSVTVRADVSATPAVVNNTARLGTSQTMLTITVDPQPIDRVQVPNTVQAGTQGQGFVRLSSPAPTGGMLVPLSTDNPAAATVPPTIVIPAGQTQANFTVSTNAVPANTEVTVIAGAGVANATFRIRAR